MHKQILARGFGLTGVWAVYVAFQAGRSAVFAWRGGLIAPVDAVRRTVDSARRTFCNAFGSRQKAALA